MTDTVYRVRVVYQTETHGAQSALGGFGSSLGRMDSQIRESQNRFLSFGNEFGRLGGFASGAFAALGAAGLAGAGLALGGMHELMQSTIGIGQQAEDTGIAIAGMLGASGASGDWTSSMTMAGDVMEKIRSDAAALPGEAEDFIAVFRAGLPKMLENGLSVEDAADLSNRTAAVGITMQIDSEQIGRDMNLIMGGHAGANVRTWNAMQSSVSDVAKTMGFNIQSAKDFNKLSGEDRVRVWDEALLKYNDMIRATQNTWSAQAGTFKSNLEAIYAFGSKPLFEEAKSTLSDINDWFADNRSELKGKAGELGDALASAFHRGRLALGGFGDSLLNLSRGPGFSRLLGTLQSFGHGASLESLIPSLGQARSLATDPAAITAAGGLAGLALGLPGLGLLVGGLTSMASEHPDETRQVTNTLTATFGELVTIGKSFAGVLSQAESFVGSALAGFLPGALEGVLSVVDPVISMMKLPAEFIGTLFERMQGPTQELFYQLGSLAQRIGSLLNSALDPLIGAFSTLLQAVQGPFMMVVDFLISSLGNFVGALNWALSALPGPGSNGNDKSNADGFDGRATFQSEVGDMLGAQWTPGPRSVQPDHTQRTRPDRPGGPGGSSRQNINVKIEQTIHDASDPDRVLIDTRRAVHAALSTPLESANGRTQVLR